MSFITKAIFILMIPALCFGKSPSTSKRGLQFLSLFKENYVYPYSYTTSNQDKTGQRSELIYQLSFKIAFFSKGRDSKGLHFAYTQKSIWQIYDEGNSRPFRETNYTPQLFYGFGGKSIHNQIGYEHSSNGQDDPLSRTWDRLYFKTKLYFNYFDFGLKLWHTLYEEQNQGEDGRRDSIQDTQGNGEVQLTLKGKNVFLDLKGRYSFKSERGSLRSTLTYPLGRYVFLGLEHFFGYNDSLIDYNSSTNRYSVGISFNR